MRLPRILRQVFLNHANDLNRRHSPRYASHPILLRNIQQLPIHQEPLRKSIHPAQTGSIPLDPGRVSVPSTVYARANLQEILTRSADIRLLRFTLRRSATSRTNKEESKQRNNQKYSHGIPPSL